MPPDLSEKNFEATNYEVQTQVLRARCSAIGRQEPQPMLASYRKWSPDHCNVSLFLDPEIVLDFVYATHPIKRFGVKPGFRSCRGQIRRPALTPQGP